MIPLSFAQRRLWFTGQLEGESATYNEPVLLRLSGQLDVEALRAALGDLVARHESLRTVFPSVRGEPYQRVTPTGEVRVLVEYVEVAAGEVGSRAAEAARYAFDLAREIPLRAHLFRTAPEEHVLLLLLHHIAGDGWSMGPMRRDLAEAYNSRLGGAAPQWAPLPVQYSDYTLWQRELLGDRGDAGSVGAHQFEYWRAQLEGLSEELQLPLDRPRSAVASDVGGIHNFCIPSDVHVSLASLAGESQSTMFMVMQAALAALLTRLGSGTDIPIGSVIAGRTDEALEDLIGFFVNTLVLRTDTSGDPSFRRLLERVRSTDLGAYANQDTPFERLVEEFNPTRTSARHPLFQVMFTFQNAEGEHPSFANLSTTWHDVGTGTAKFDLDVGMAETFTSDRQPAGISAHIQYRSELFDHSTVMVIAERLVRLLEGVAADPDLPISQIDVLGTAERELLLGAWNDTAVVFADELTVHELVERQVARVPGAVAVVCGESQLTYRELNARANQLARHLMGQGAGAGSLVAVCLERGPDMIIALLGILKAGAAYVPMDPDYPEQRLEFMLRDTHASLMVTQAALVQRFAGSGVECVLMDRDRPVLDALADADLRPQATPDALAYVIYTSGSTGIPKGVMIEHRSMSNRLQEMRRKYALGGSDRTLQFASVSFDAAAEQIYPTLMSGGCIVLRDSDKWTPARIVREIHDNGITVADLTPSLWQQIIPHLAADPGLGSAFRLMVLGGEQISEDLLGEWFKHTVIPIHNTYGPTETTITSTSHLITQGAPAALIGRPIANTEVYVMDEYGQLAPIGVPGELWIGGVGLARGYLNQPELTREKFVPHPFSADPHARLYRSGDRVRWLPDGNLEFVGRVDHQVKLRGLRIELGEIETVLTSHDQITAAVVMVREDTSGDKRLVAYIAPTAGADPGTPALRAWCKRTLPDYMVPGWFVSLPALPLTPNGKIDRKALPKPPSERPDLADTYTAPRNEIETAIADIWSDVLGIDRIGIHDNFFDLGGHSLLATRVINQIEFLTGLNISLKEFFLAPTVGSLVQKLLDLISSSEADHFVNDDGSGNY
ncbi:amino acid adenylation domain-containing protein [Streptomyces umbrinus]|uniref:Amino acid adenylation domain-containing protein n=1 Tax=Streptomyces umbrinus TaxID=67370 RepID=A0ABU0SQ50_9ACTN|nr:amino acid adenylation domain-containing protein [Streptomyces umbrinus]MDQ1024654.1 amino acid adenylation domain-containing protein [Streptomyces umbrinus]